MPNSTGIVEVISSKERTSSRTGKAFTVYSMKVEGEWYDCKFTTPKCSKGDNIEFYYRDTQYGREASLDTITVLKTQSSNDTVVAPTGKTPFYNNNVQESIMRQSSRKDAIEIVQLALEQGAIVLPAKKADKLEALLEYVQVISSKLFNNLMSPPKTEAEVPIQEEPLDD